MLPSQRSDVARDVLRDRQRTDRLLEIAGVPQDDGGDEQVDAGSAIGLVLEPPVAQLTELVKEERAGDRTAEVLTSRFRINFVTNPVTLPITLLKSPQMLERRAPGYVTNAGQTRRGPASMEKDQ